MTMVARQTGESVERLISRFRRTVIKYGVMKQARSERYHRKKPTKRIQKLRAQYRVKNQKALEQSMMGM